MTDTMQDKMAVFIEECTEEHFAKVEGLTRDQFKEALKQAIESGDVVWYVSTDCNEHRQAVIYAPFTEKKRLEAEMEAMKCCVNCDHGEKRDGNSLVSWGCEAPFGTQKYFTGCKCDGWKRISND